MANFGVSVGIAGLLARIAKVKKQEERVIQRRKTLEKQYEDTISALKREGWILTRDPNAPPPDDLATNGVTHRRGTKRQAALDLLTAQRGKGSLSVTEVYEQVMQGLGTSRSATGVMLAGLADAKVIKRVSAGRYSAK